MKLIICLILLSSTLTAFAQVYCDQWVSRDGRVGYSLYRQYDRRDVGNAFFTDLYECRDAAEVSNRAGNDIACSKYYNNNTQKTFYSVYRISDLQDLGRWGFSDFNQCQLAVKYSTRSFFCGTYVKNGSDAGFSVWSIRSNQDVGTQYYRSLEGCLQQLGAKDVEGIESLLVNTPEVK